MTSLNTYSSSSIILKSDKSVKAPIKATKNYSVVPENLMSVKNYSTQGLSILLNNASGPEFVWLAPRESIIVQESQISDQIRTLHERRLLQIRN